MICSTCFCASCRHAWSARKIHALSRLGTQVVSSEIASISLVSEVARSSLDQCQSYAINNGHYCKNLVSGIMIGMQSEHSLQNSFGVVVGA